MRCSVACANGEDEVRGAGKSGRLFFPAAAWTVSDCSGKQTMIDPQRVSLIKRAKFKEA